MATLGLVDTFSTSRTVRGGGEVERETHTSRLHV